MQFSINDETKILSIWITNCNISKEKIPFDIEEKIRNYKEKKYKICIYKSGSNDLKKDLLKLLVNNEKV